MGLDRIEKGDLSKINLQQKKFRPGQIIRGKIVKLYPNNKAEILLGSQKMVAQVQTPLTIGERYYFQVETGYDVLHLKVLGGKLDREEKINIENMLQQLGLKMTKMNVQFIQALNNQKVSFDGKQLELAFQLLDRAKDKRLAQHILKEMIAVKMPMTNTVFQALLTYQSNGITNQMTATLSSLVENKTYTMLVDRLNQMVERPLDLKATLVKQILTDNKHHNPQFLNLLKVSGLVKESIDFSTWKSQWEAFEERNNVTLMNIHQQRISTALPFKIDSKMIKSTLEEVILNKNQLQRHTEEILQTWGNRLSLESIKSNELTEPEFAVLKQQITQKLMPLLTISGQQKLTTILQRDPLNLQQISTSLRTLNDEQTMMKAEDIITKIKLDNIFLNATSKDQFLIQLNQVLHLTGLSYEHQLLYTDIEQQETTIKGMLLQVLQKSDGVIHEHAQQLLHFINGMQINAMNETNHFIQVNLQIPGERMTLTKDIELEFEGSKTNSGEINPDYCRIAFYLDLAHLKQTVIDMNIHKRLVTITIYNDVKELNNQSLALQPLLKQGLADLDYQLVGIVFKPLREKPDSGLSDLNKVTYPTYQGVDYRV